MTQEQQKLQGIKNLVAKGQPLSKQELEWLIVMAERGLAGGINDLAKLMGIKL